MDVLISDLFWTRYARIDWAWQEEGSIKAAVSFLALPQLSYDHHTRQGLQRIFTDLALLLLICYQAFWVVDSIALKYDAAKKALAHIVSSSFLDPPFPS